MIESIDARLREVGIFDQDVQTRLDGKEKALVITHQDLMYVDAAGVQRTPLRFVTKVITDKVGSLTVRSSNGPNIEGNIRGFDVTELKVFFEGVKGAIARAKTEGAAKPESEITPQPASPSAPGVASAPFGAVPAGLDLGSSKPDFAEPFAAPVEPAPAQTPTVPPPAASPPAAQLADPWENFSTPRPTLEIPPSTRLPDDFEDFRSASASIGEVSSKDTDAFDWDDPLPINQPPRPSAAALSSQMLDDEPMLEADDFGPSQPAPTPSPTPAPMPTPTPVPVPAPTPAAAGLAAAPLATTPKDVLDMPRAADSAKKMPTLAENYAISPIGRWLKFLAIFPLLIGIAGAGLSVPATDSPQITQWLQVAAIFFGGLTVAGISYGIGDLLSIWGAMAADIRAIRRNQADR